MTLCQRFCKCEPPIASKLHLKQLTELLVRQKPELTTRENIKTAKQNNSYQSSRARIKPSKTHTSSFPLRHNGISDCQPLRVSGSSITIEEIKALHRSAVEVEVQTGSSCEPTISIIANCGTAAQVPTAKRAQKRSYRPIGQAVTILLLAFLWLHDAYGVCEDNLRLFLPCPVSPRALSLASTCPKTPTLHFPRANEGKLPKYRQMFLWASCSHIVTISHIVFGTGPHVREYSPSGICIRQTTHRLCACHSKTKNNATIQAATCKTWLVMGGC